MSLAFATIVEELPLIVKAVLVVGYFIYSFHFLSSFTFYLKICTHKLSKSYILVCRLKAAEAIIKNHS